MCMKVINVYSFVCYSAVLLWILNPLFIRGYPLKKRDGSLVIYRNSVLNTLLSFIPISIYERIYPIVYLIEAIEISHITYDIVFYYTIVIQFCWMLTAQLKIIAFKCESCGYENEEIVFYYTIVIHFCWMLSAQLKIMTYKCESFGYKNVNLGQKNGNNYTKNLNQILLDYTKINILQNYFKNGCEMSVIFAKLLLTTLAVSIDLFIMCYYYGYLENEKTRKTFFFLITTKGNVHEGQS
ncbi:uncharacterized protein LOC126907352 [Daktulosphaira vitifoliae]|uniref:uncharacterized protein LOC126907352 n=1 Tax=Daktulosphaira vitifoliae TaxID=58002 RepID=UPI0021AB05CB|nr:uncharacterized protein LOC126907352 [Daktulosphaira vitifoliae]